MEQKVQCPRCGFQNEAGFKFCINCGERLAERCSNCGIAVSSAYKFCPNCGGELNKGSKPEEKPGPAAEKAEAPAELGPKALLEDIRAIGAIKNELPFNQQHWCDILGLNVWYRNLDRYTHGVDGVWVKARGRFSTRIEGWTDPKELWEVKKYKHGDWEALVKPTLEITRWLQYHGGLRVEDREAFLKAVETFKKTGKLSLPD